MRKSFKVMPGVRMTVTPRGVSASVGGKAGRVTVNSRGRVTTTARVPGTGIAYVKSSGGNTPRKTRTTNAANQHPKAQHSTTTAAPARKPGVFAPKWEKVLHKAIAAGQYDSLSRIARDHPQARLICMVLDAFLAAEAGDRIKARALLEELWASGYEPASDRFLETYAVGCSATVSLAAGVMATMPLGRDLVGLTLAELRQAQSDLSGAVEIVESLEPSALTACSLADLYSAQGRWNEVIELTNDIESSDDFSSFLLSQRGVAFREQGHYTAAREAFKAALARRSQPAELRHNTLAERATTYRREGKRAMARKDYERILARDPAYPGLAEALAALDSEAGT